MQLKHVWSLGLAHVLNKLYAALISILQCALWFRKYRCFGVRHHCICLISLKKKKREEVKASLTSYIETLQQPQRPAGGQSTPGGRRSHSPPLSGPRHCYWKSKHRNHVSTPSRSVSYTCKFTDNDLGNIWISILTVTQVWGALLLAQRRHTPCPVSWKQCGPERSEKVSSKLHIFIYTKIFQVTLESFLKKL